MTILSQIEAEFAALCASAPAPKPATPAELVNVATLDAQVIALAAAAAQPFADRVVTSYSAALKATRPLRAEARHAARKRLSVDFMRLMDMARQIEGPRSFSVAV